MTRHGNLPYSESCCASPPLSLSRHAGIEFGFEGTDCYHYHGEVAAQCRYLATVMYLGSIYSRHQSVLQPAHQPGHSSIYMWSTISLSLLQIVAVCAIYPYGLEWMLRIFVIINIGWLFVWFRFVKREIGLRLRDMLKDISPYLSYPLYS